ncbi:hypothetical protein ENUP19_0230G0006 [Entamoeba nuttalli]|uniref:Uncharacterized protein n=2 Tax=Entamoeba nuttalli TaxID=412467 RepID=K2G3Y1_ENTNP|nr:hypothetical protein ENU1_212710 [Entamoeba nuttalli P19]EKE37001.1 hypothetical protein ENU1_212710 [Entamoeba nuttalli P19]|eukprot:XP_008860664.1 hypothetical protein ENU1_212710 [Entamoeba nuttalli P19]
MKRLSKKTVLLIKTQLSEIERKNNDPITDELLRRVVEQIREGLLTQSLDELIICCSTLQGEVKIKELKIKKFINGLNGEDTKKYEDKIILLMKVRKSISSILQQLNFQKKVILTQTTLC